MESPNATPEPSIRRLDWENATSCLFLPKSEWGRVASRDLATSRCAPEIGIHHHYHYHYYPDQLINDPIWVIRAIPA